jgi:hypothetical protein
MAQQLTPDPEALYDKPHAVDLAQIMMVFQYFMVVSVSVGTFPRLFNWFKGETSDVPVLADLEARIDIGSSYPIEIVLPAVVVLTIPYAILVLDLGFGIQWARIAAFLVVPATTVVGMVGVVRTYGEIVAMVVSPVWLIVALCVIGGLASRNGRQWFRQGGWTPWYVRYEMVQESRRRRPVRRTRTRRRRRVRSLDQVEDAD